MKKTMLMIVGMMLAGMASALEIASCEQDGYLTFTNENTSLYYRVEFRPNLSGSEDWDGHHAGWKNIHSTNSLVKVPMGIFYRVVGTSNRIDVGTANPGDIRAGHTIYVGGDYVTGSLHTITYALNGGFNSASNRSSFSPETDTFTLYEPYKVGATFQGWYTNSDFSGTTVAEVVSGTAMDLTLYAGWTWNPVEFYLLEEAQSWVVPVGVTNVHIECWGAEGDGVDGGGLGGYAQGNLALSPGDVLSVYVGGRGHLYYGGWNGGADPGKGGWAGGGGGASDVRVGGTNLTNRVIVAGGGGGGGQYTLGGNGGGTSGASGEREFGACAGGKGYGGGPTSGGSGGGGSDSGDSGQLGTGGNGGTRSVSSDLFDSGGGGGGGWYGGGGGGAACEPDEGGGGGGGGGSGYIGGVTGGSMQSGVRSGNGKVIITPL